MRTCQTSSLGPQAAPLFDAVLFKKIAARLGGRIKLIISGGAPLAKHVEQFLRVTMCAAVVQGYGLTETCAASFIALPEEYVRVVVVVVNTLRRLVPFVCGGVSCRLFRHSKLKTTQN